jgi:hypothetical protein
VRDASGLDCNRNRNSLARDTTVEHYQVIEAFAPIDPMSRSTWPFCRGERGAVG